MYVENETELTPLHYALQAAAFLDPASTVFKQPLNYTLPALAYGTQMDMEKPACCKMGLSYFHYYSMLTCPKILMNVTVRPAYTARIIL